MIFIISSEVLCVARSAATIEPALVPQNTSGFIPFSSNALLLQDEQILHTKQDLFFS
jgi:hypothetical protein